MDSSKKIIELNKNQEQIIKNLDLTINKLEKIKILISELKELGLDVSKSIQ